MVGKSKLIYCKKCFTMYSGPPVESFCGCQRFVSPNEKMIKAFDFYLAAGYDRITAARKAVKSVLEQRGWEHWQDVNNPGWRDFNMKKARHEAHYQGKQIEPNKQEEIPF